MAEACVARAEPCPLFALDAGVPANLVVGEAARITGWCFVPGARIVRAWASDGRRHDPVTVGLDRPDVARAYPDEPAARESGFEWRVDFEPGLHTIGLTAELDDGTSLVLQELVIAIDSGEVLAALDTPVGTVIAGPVRFSGWMFHTRHRIDRLVLRIGEHAHRAHHGILRPDVAEHHAAYATAPDAGYELELVLEPGIYGVRAEATLSTGVVHRVELPSCVVRAKPWPVRIAARWRGIVARARGVESAARQWIADRGRLPRPSEIPELVRAALRLFRSSPGPLLPYAGAPGFEPEPVQDPYGIWLSYNAWNDARATDLAARLERTQTPSISVVMPVYRPDQRWLERAIESLREQVHQGWELCIADDASGDDALTTWLHRLAADDPRIHFITREVNGNISLATNSAATLARGDFLLFLDQDDELSPDALGEIALALARSPNCDLLYTDDDKIDASGRRFAPQFKPDWSPELLLSYMYMSHALVVRRELFAELGGFRPGFEGSQDYDFALRASERARAIEHLARVTYHWRVLPGSTATSGDAKPAAMPAGMRAVAEAAARRGIPASVSQPEWARRGAVGIFELDFPDDGPSVEILIPTRNQHAVLARCIDSLARTSYRNYRVTVIDNESDDPAALAYFGSLPHRVVRIANPDGRFNYAHINNEGARLSDADFVLFLNNDTEVLEPRWLSRMVGHAGVEGVGAVGARLLYPDRRVQHAGIVHGLYGGLAGPAFKLAAEWDGGYLGYAKCTRNCTAVTAACMLTPRRLFLELGGFDAHRFGVAYNDVDYCYRVVDAGMRCVYVAGAELLHHEGLSRGFGDNPDEIRAFRERYPGRVDRYYNPNLTLEHERHAVAPRAIGAPAHPRARALMVCFNLNWEGAPYSQFEMTKALRDAGVIEPVVYSPTEGPLRAEYERHGIEVLVEPHPLRGVHDAPAYDAAIGRFAASMRTRGIALAYGNTLQTFYAIDAARVAGIPSVWNVRESEPWQTYFSHLGELAPRALRCFEHPYRVVFVANATRQGFAALETRHNFTVIHNGLDPARVRAAAAGVDRAAVRAELGVRPEELLVVTVGTVCDRKGQLDIPAALAVMPDAARARLKWLVVGDRPGAYSAELHSARRALPAAVRERLIVLPESEDVARYYLAADVFACTSRIESYPRVILEAMAYGLPVVTTPAFGIVEQVRAGYNGDFYRAGAVDELAEQVARMLDPAYRASRARWALPMLHSLESFESMVAKYASVFAEAAALPRAERADR